MTITHIMLDLETWGTKPGCDLRSIGACVFDPTIGLVSHAGTNAHVGWHAPFYIATDNPEGNIHDHTTYDDGCQTYRKYPLTRDPQTVQWWNEQSPEAQAAFTNPVDLRDGLERFAEWFTRLAYPAIHIYTSPIFSQPRNLMLWSHGPAFDIAILVAAYDAVGLPVPWHYRAPRDTRTCFDMAGIEDHSEWLNGCAMPGAVQHHALNDAVSQAKAVCGAYAIVAGWKHGHDDNAAHIETLRGGGYIA